MSPRRKHPTREWIVPLGGALIMAGFAVALNWSTITSAYDNVTSPDASTERAEPPPATAEWLIAAHDCWTGDAPADVDLPGGVVVRVDGGDAEYSENAMVIGAALDAALDGVDNGVEAVAFCRGGQ